MYLIWMLQINIEPHLRNIQYTYSWFELFNYFKRNNWFNRLLDVIGRLLAQQQLDLVADLTLVVLEEEVVWLSRKTWLGWRQPRAVTGTGGPHLPVSALLHDSPYQ